MQHYGPTLFFRVSDPGFGSGFRIRVSDPGFGYTDALEPLAAGAGRVLGGEEARAALQKHAAIATLAAQR